MQILGFWSEVGFTKCWQIGCRRHIVLQLYSMVIATIVWTSIHIWKYPAKHCTGHRATIGWTSPPFGWTALTSPDIASDIRTLTRPFLSGQNDFTFYIEKRLQCAMCMVTARISISVYLYQLCMNQLEDTRSLLNERWFVRILSRHPAVATLDIGLVSYERRLWTQRGRQKWANQVQIYLWLISSEVNTVEMGKKG